MRRMVGREAGRETYLSDLHRGVVYLRMRDWSSTRYHPYPQVVGQSESLLYQETLLLQGRLRRRVALPVLVPTLTHEGIL